MAVEEERPDYLLLNRRRQLARNSNRLPRNVAGLPRQIRRIT